MAGITTNTANFEAFLKGFQILHLHQPTQRIIQEHCSTIRSPFEGQHMSVTCAFLCGRHSTKNVLIREQMSRFDGNWDSWI
ncbi:hypothetical protein CAEBREN_12345 [Caenorhabditis brenneri]|uniref:Uncharacterized protein n=1 Tax=Caenorhabditis brenneri TaxID=135651 RepID=G0NS25_CAEBE|nr:hypothetical protein CAEBREN_12345 [Caenorhabditis brenneri]